MTILEMYNSIRCGVREDRGGRSNPWLSQGLLSVANKDLFELQSGRLLLLIHRRQGEHREGGRLDVINCDLTDMHIL